MSENSNSASVYELGNSTRLSSATPSPVTGTPDSPDSTSHLILTPKHDFKGKHPIHTIINEVDEDPAYKVMEGQMNALQEEHRQPFFTFGLKYEDPNGAVNIEFIVSFFLSTQSSNYFQFVKYWGQNPQFYYAYL